MEPWLENFARTNFRRSSDTAHDLKTPLNVAVLNLELLRMRIRKLAGDDEKIEGYARAIETELRRMGQIFDTFFLLSAPPKNEVVPATVDLAAIARETAEAASIPLTSNSTYHAKAHEARIRQALKSFFEGASRLFRVEGRTVSATAGESGFQVDVTGSLASPDIELSKIFKFYYTDPDGNPDLSLASARLIVETYGGEVRVEEMESDKVILRLSVPPGEK